MKLNPLELQTVDQLINFYLDPKRWTVYNNRWDTYLILHSKWDNLVLLKYAPVLKLTYMTDTAREKAEKIRTSKLYKALNNEIV